MPREIGAGHAQFQSTPVISGGRATQRIGQADLQLCFNPRPSFLAGEPSVEPARCGVGRVSIHARHFWRASPALSMTARAYEKVSIHARHFWRASPVGTAMIHLIRASFNPRPSFLAGEPLM